MQTKPFCMGKCINNIKVKISAQNSEASGKGTARERDKEKPDKQKPYTHTHTWPQFFNKNKPVLLLLFFRNMCLHVLLLEQENGLFPLSAMCENWPCRFSFSFFVYRFRSVSISQYFLRNAHCQEKRQRERAWSFHIPLSLVLLFTPRSAICEVEKIQ